MRWEIVWRGGIFFSALCGLEFFLLGSSSQVRPFWVFLNWFELLKCWTEEILFWSWDSLMDILAPLLEGICPFLLDSAPAPGGKFSFFPYSIAHSFQRNSKNLFLYCLLLPAPNFENILGLFWEPGLPLLYPLMSCVCAFWTALCFIHHYFTICSLQKFH